MTKSGIQMSNQECYDAFVASQGAILKLETFILIIRMPDRSQPPDLVISDAPHLCKQPVTKMSSYSSLIEEQIPKREVGMGVEWIHNPKDLRKSSSSPDRRHGRLRGHHPFPLESVAMDDCNVIILDTLRKIWRRPEGSKVLGASVMLLGEGSCSWRLYRSPYLCRSEVWPKSGI